MIKRISILVAVFLSLLCVNSLLFAQSSEESITFTTYYPAPYGVYNEMRSNKMVIGDTNTSSTPAPSNGAITFSPASVPTTFSRGTLYYDNSADNFKYRNNSGWQTMGGGGGTSFTEYCFSDASFGIPVCTDIDAGGTQGHCPSGYTQKLALGSWGYCGHSAYGDSYSLPPGGHCSVGVGGSNVVGSAYVCSQ